MSSERVFLVGIKGCGKKTICKFLQKFFPQLFPPSGNNIVSLDLTNTRVDDRPFKKLSAETFRGVTITVFVVSCERGKDQIRIQESYFKKLDATLEKFAPDTALLILVHKKDLFVDPIQRRDFLTKCAKFFRRKRGKTLIVSTSARDYSIKRAFSKILKLREIMPPVAQPEVALPPMKPPAPAPSVASPTPHAKLKVPTIVPHAQPKAPEPPPIVEEEVKVPPLPPPIAEGEVEVPTEPPLMEGLSDDRGIQLERAIEPVDQIAEEEQERVEGVEPSEFIPSLVPSELIPTSDEKLTREEFLKATQVELEKIDVISEAEIPPPEEYEQPEELGEKLNVVKPDEDVSEIVEEMKEHIAEGLIDILQSEDVESLEKAADIVAEELEEAIPLTSEASLLDLDKISDEPQMTLSEAEKIVAEVGSQDEATHSNVLEDMDDLFELSEQLEEDMSAEDVEEFSKAFALVEFLEDIKEAFNLDAVGIIDLESREEIVMTSDPPNRTLETLQQAVLEAMKHAEAIQPIQVWGRGRSDQNLAVARKITSTLAVVFTGSEQACESLKREITGISDQIKIFLWL